MTSTTLLFTRPSTLALAVTAAIASGSALANSNHYTELDQVVVTESRTAADTDIVIDEDALEKRQANDIADIFAGNPEVTVGGSAPAAQKIYVRGLEDTLLNVSVDGATQGGQLFHHQGRLLIDPELLKQVEVSAGAGEATNGPGALGGAIRFITKDPEDLLRPGQRVGATLKGGYYSNTDGFKTSASVYGHLTDDWSAMATLSRTDLGEYEDGDGNTQPYTGTELNTGFAKVVGQLTDEQKLSLSYERSRDQALRLTKAHMPGNARNTPINQDLQRETITGKYGFNANDNDLIDADLTLYRTESTLDQYEGRWGDIYASSESYGGDLRNKSRLGANTLTYGVDYRHDEGVLYQPKFSLTDTDKGRVTGIYLQDHFQVTDRLLLSAGARYDWYQLDEARSGRSYSESGFSPNLGFSLDVTDELNLHGGWARALRGTQVKEVYLLEFENAPDRKEETADNYELGVTYRSGGLHLNAEAFVTHIDDIVGRNDNRQLGNLGDLKNKGFTAGVGYDWARVSAGLSYSQSRPEFEGQPLSDWNMGIGTSQGDLWVASLDFRPIESVDLGWSGRFSERLTTVADTHSEKPGYAVHDVYARWRPLAGDQLTLSLSVNNLFDKQYLDHATFADPDDITAGLPESGRDIRLSAAYRF